MRPSMHLYKHVRVCVCGGISSHCERSNVGQKNLMHIKTWPNSIKQFVQ